MKLYEIYESNFYSLLSYDLFPNHCYIHSNQTNIIFNYILIYFDIKFSFLLSKEDLSSGKWKFWNCNYEYTRVCYKILVIIYKKP